MSNHTLTFYLYSKPAGGMLNHLTKHKLPYNLVMIALAH